MKPSYLFGFAGATQATEEAIDHLDGAQYHL